MSFLILVVYDESDVEMLFRQQFRRDLRAGRFTMDFAQSGDGALQRISGAVPVVNQNRIYWWYSPPRTGPQRMCPVRSTARETGASFFKDRCVRTSL